MSGLGLLGASYGSSSSDSESEDDTKKDKAKSNNGKSSEAAPPPPPAESLTNPFATATSSTLPRPSFMQESVDFSKGSGRLREHANSVFFNPFKAREDAKQKILEQHVAVTTRQEELRTIGGKKVCWNFRKGRCRFGHNCSFAHDSDIGLKKRAPDADKVIEGGSVGDVKDKKQQQHQQQHQPQQQQVPSWSNPGPILTNKSHPNKSQPQQPPPQPPPPAAVPPSGGPVEYDEGAVIEGGGVKKKKRPGLSDGLVPGKKAMKFHNRVYNAS